MTPSRLLRSLAPLVVLAATLPVAHGLQRTGMEEFSELDPYTKGEPEVLEACGYASIGQFLWKSPDHTQHAAEHMGSPPTVWLECANFKLGSSLNTYEMPNDRPERAKLKAELARLKERMGRVRFPKRELDPWLRLHVWAQRCEETIDAFCAAFDLTEEDRARLTASENGQGKSLILLCERESEFNRYLQHYHGASSTITWSTPLGKGQFWGISSEYLKRNYANIEEAPLDAIMHCRLIAGLSDHMVSRYGASAYNTPHWFKSAVRHFLVRNVDHRYTVGNGMKSGHVRRDGEEEWEERVANLSKNDLAASVEEMFGWQDYSKMSTREHIVAWSRLKFLLTVAEGDRRGFLHDVLEVDGRSPEGRVERQVSALRERFGLTPEEFQKAWTRWVKKGSR